MGKHTQTICRQQATSCLIVFDHFVGLELSTKKKKKKKKKTRKSSPGNYTNFFSAVILKNIVSKRGI